MNGSDYLLNGAAALGGGLGAMPVALPYSLGGVAPGLAMQGGDAGMAGMGAMGGAALPLGMINRDGQQFMGQQQPQQAMTIPQDNRDMAAYQMMAKGLQGMGRGMQQGFPSANTAQIMRDQSRPQFVGSPQQQMAQALRNRG